MDVLRIDTDALRIITDVPRNLRTPSPASPHESVQGVEIDGWLDIRAPPPVEPITNQHTHTNPIIYPLASVSRLADWTPLDLGHMDVICPNCQALHWKKEAINPKVQQSRFMICCKHGDMDIPLLKPLPEPLRRLLHSADSDAHNFRQHIRQYNAALTFTSLGYKPDEHVQVRSGVSCFQIHGELYHLHGPLQPCSP